MGDESLPTGSTYCHDVLSVLKSGQWLPGPARICNSSSAPYLRVLSTNKVSVSLMTIRSSRCTALHCTALHCTALHCTALHCTALHCTALHCTALHLRLVAPPTVVESTKKPTTLSYVPDGEPWIQSRPCEPDARGHVVAAKSMPYEDLRRAVRRGAAVACAGVDCDGRVGRATPLPGHDQHSE